jgi:hypothetical protein
MPKKGSVAFVGTDGPAIPTLLALIYDHMLRRCSGPGGDLRFITSPSAQIELGGYHNSLLSRSAPSARLRELDLTLTVEEVGGVAGLFRRQHAADLRLHVLRLGKETSLIFNMNIRSVVLVPDPTGVSREGAMSLLEDIPKGSWFAIAPPYSISKGALPMELRERADDMFQIMLKGDAGPDGSMRPRTREELGRELEYDESEVRRLLERMAFGKVIKSRGRFPSEDR